jgi:hypothetical protein
MYPYSLQIELENWNWGLEYFVLVSIIKAIILCFTIINVIVVGEVLLYATMCFLFGLVWREKGKQRTQWLEGTSEKEEILWKWMRFDTLGWWKKNMNEKKDGVHQCSIPLKSKHCLEMKLITKNNWS